MKDSTVFLIGLACGAALWAGWTYAAARFVLWRETRGWENEPEPVTVTFTVDTRPFTEAMGRLSAAFASVGPLIVPGLTRAVQDMQDSMTRLKLTLARREGIRPSDISDARREVKVAGLCAKYQVRAGLDPTYAGPDGLTTLLREIQWVHRPLGGEWRPQVARLDTGELTTVMAAAIRGWADQYARGAATSMAEVRRYGSTLVTVVAA